MPSVTVAEALILLWQDGGQPWTWPRWQEITGIRHTLFPEKGRDDLLPDGMTRKDSDDILSFFLAYKDRPSAKKSDLFKSDLPGRKKWVDFVSARWGKWGIHSLISKAFNKAKIHPISLVSVDPSLVNNWPCANDWLPRAFDAIATELGGDDPFLVSEDGDVMMLPNSIAQPIKHFALRSWNSIRVKVKGDRKRMETLEAKCEASIQAVHEGAPTRQKVAAVIRHVARWRDLSLVYNSKENVAKANQMIADLDDIMESIGVKQAKKVKKPNVRRRLKLSQYKLATEKEISDLEAMYRDFFPKDFAHDDYAQAIPDAAKHVKLGDVVAGDLGVEVEKHMDYKTLCRRLLFTSTAQREPLPCIFNTLRHKADVSPWESPELFVQTDHPDLRPNRLHWHQLAAIHSILRNAFHSKSNNITRGKIEGDEVGLGKTSTVAGVLGFLIQAGMINKKELAAPTPPILQETPFLKLNDHIPNCPHIIVCPGTLTKQWILELHKWFLPSSVDILEYEHGDDDFWGPEGRFRSSNHQKLKRIIITTHSSLVAEARRVFKASLAGSSSDQRPWHTPPRTVPLCEKSPSCLFDLRYVTAIIDEAHLMRNLNMKHWAALAIMSRAEIRIPVTATPLLTSHQDISAMGRLAGVDYFLSETSHEQDLVDTIELRTAKRKRDGGVEEKATLDDIIDHLYKMFEGRIIRRTPESLDFDGKKLLNVPEPKRLTLVLGVTDREKAILDERMKPLKADLNTSNEKDEIIKKHFFLVYRLNGGYAKTHQDDPYPEFATLEAWREEMSTKMDSQARAIDYLLTHDRDAPDVYTVDGNLVIPDVPPGDPESLKNRRILVYSEFCSMHPLMKNVFKLYGHEAVSLDGKLSFKKRDQMIANFLSPNSSARILIFSSVGGAGLNLSDADVISFFDQPWSGQEERQIEGRSIRQGQSESVKILHWLLKDTSDLHLHSMARGKRDMFKQFMHEGREDLINLMNGKVAEDGLDEEEGQQNAASTASNSTGTPSDPLNVAQEPLSTGRASPLMGDASTKTTELPDISTEKGTETRADDLAIQDDVHTPDPIWSEPDEAVPPTDIDSDKMSLVSSDGKENAKIVKSKRKAPGLVHDSDDESGSESSSLDDSPSQRIRKKQKPLSVRQISPIPPPTYKPSSYNRLPPALESRKAAAFREKFLEVRMSASPSSSGRSTPSSDGPRTSMQHYQSGASNFARQSSSPFASQSDSQPNAFSRPTNLNDIVPNRNALGVVRPKSTKKRKYNA